jgi:hypothetical protein
MRFVFLPKTFCSARGRNDMLVVTWPDGKQRVSLALGGGPAKPRLIESVDIDNDGKSIYLALLSAPGIWHKEELTASYLEKDVASKWKRPFSAKWVTQLDEAGVKTRFTFKESKQEKICGRHRLVRLSGLGQPGWRLLPPQQKNTPKR